MCRFNARLFASCLLLIAIVFPSKIEAGAMLTPQALSDGFGLTTFVSGFHQRTDVGNTSLGGVGPLGIAFVGNGVIISDGDGYVRSLPARMDGQIIPAVDSSTPFYNFVGAMGLAELNGQYYAGGYFNNPGLLRISSTGVFQSNVSNDRLRSIAVDSVHNVLYAAGTGIFRYDPIANSYTSLASLIPDLNTEVDGITTDGTILYATSSFTGNGWESVRGYRLSDGVMVFDSGRIDGVDGAILGQGSLAGKLYANTNFGELYEINLLDSSQKRLIMTGGTRGDFVTVDPFNGTLLVTQSTEILRLSAPTGGSFLPLGGTSSIVPEPNSCLVFVISSLCGLSTRIRNRKR